MTLDERITRSGQALRCLAERLRQLDYRFRSPAEVLPGPEVGTGDAIARIEREVGSIPLAVKSFWQRVASVDFCGVHPTWGGCEFPDPLVIYPPSAAVAELDDFLADRDERLRVGFPFAIPVAPDAFHKADVGGGMWYNVSVPAVADDPPLNAEWHDTTFLGYLEIAVQWGGFPGLSRCKTHSWPVDELRGAASAGV